MNTVVFPALGLKVNISQIMFKIGNIEVYWYGFFIVLAFIVSLILLKKLSKEFNIEFDNILELFILIVPVSIICARLYYILFNLDYYLNHINEILRINSGGLAIYGGIIGGVLTILIYTKVKEINFLNLLDMISILLPLGQAIGRWGNFFNIEAYGYETTSILRMGIFENGNYVEVHPTFFYESIMCFIIFIVLFKFRKYKKFDGENVCIYLCFYGFIRSIIEGLRQDSLYLGNVKISQIISILLCIIFVCVLIYKNIKLNKKESKIEEKK